METKDELLSECEKYFEKVRQDFNQNRKGRNLRKYCNDEGIDYKWLSEYKRTYGATKPLTQIHDKELRAVIVLLGELEHSVQYLRHEVG